MRTSFQPVEELQHEPSQILPFRGGTLFYRKIGEGAPIIFLHSYPMDSRIWLLKPEFLSKLGQVFLIDLPMHGASRCKASGSYLDACCEAVFTLLAHEGIKSCSLVAHLTGGSVALELIDRKPHLFKNVAFLACSGEKETAHDKANKIAAARLLLEGSAKQFCDAQRFAWRRIYPDCAAKFQSILKDNIGKNLVWPLLNFACLTDRLDSLKHYPGNVLSLVGDRDFSHQRTAARLAEAAPNSEFHQISEAGQLLFLDAPIACREILRRFLREG